MNLLDQVITAHEAAQMLGGSSRANLRKVQRYCSQGKILSRQDEKGTWLILKSSVQAIAQKDD